MGNALGLCVVAEGVELASQRALLAEWGCHVIQGFLVGRPEPADQAFARLRPDETARQKRSGRSTMSA